MENVTLFFCDICGTLDSKGSFNLDYNETVRFIDNLNRLILYNGTDKLLFSFVTTENLDTVILMEQQLKLYMNDKIYIGEHIYYDGVNNVDKPYDILMYIQRLELIYNINNNIYYADDSEFFHFILTELIEHFNINYKIKSIIPKYNGLNDINIILEGLFDDFSNKKYYLNNK